VLQVLADVADCQRLQLLAMVQLSLKRLGGGCIALAS
jgi:hypothetical protein